MDEYFHSMKSKMGIDLTEDKNEEIIETRNVPIQDFFKTLHPTTPIKRSNIFSKKSHSIQNKRTSGDFSHLMTSDSLTPNKNRVIENFLTQRLKKSPVSNLNKGKLDNLLSALELVNKEAIKGGYGSSAESKAGDFLKGIS